MDAALRRGLRPVILLGGASLDRIDHLLANAALLAHPRYRDLRPTWWVGNARVAPVHGRIELDGSPGDLVTLLAVGGPATGVTTTGLRWVLDGDTLPTGSTRGVSNEMTGAAAAVTVAAGTLLAIHTPLTVQTGEAR
jgi:thiamine pyrophosphokinase